MNDDEIYKYDDNEAKYQDILEKRCTRTLLSPQSLAEDEEMIQQINTDLQTCIEKLENNTPEKEEYGEAFIELEFMINNPVYSKIEVVLSSPLLFILMNEIHLETNFATKALKLLKNISYSPAHVHKMEEYEIIEFVPYFVNSINMIDNDDILKLFSNLLNSQTFLDACIDRFTDILITIPLTMPRDEDTCYERSKMLTILGSKLFDNTDFINNCCVFYEFSLESGFSCVQEELSKLFDSFLRNPNFDFSTYPKLFDMMKALSTEWLYILLLFSFHIDKLQDHISDIALDRLFERLQNETGIKQGQTPEHKLEDHEISIILFFLFKILKRNILCVNEGFVDMVTPLIFGLFETLSFFPKHYLLLFTCAFLKRIPNEILIKMDNIEMFLGVFQDMFDNNDSKFSAQDIKDEITEIVIHLFLLGQRIKPELCETIMENEIIQIIGEYIDSDETEDNPSHGLYMKFYELFHTD